METYALELTGINKSFSGVHVLKDVSLRVRKGEVHALMGENGAGKSTLMKILMGIYTKDSGSIKIGGKEIVNKNPKEALERGISMIHQELNPVLDIPVYENVYMGREIRNAAGIVDKKKEQKETQQLLDSLNIDISATELMRNLSVAQCQLIEIVKAISVNARIVIMDEPTSAITDHEIETLFQQIEYLKKNKVAVIYISHKMEEIFQICDWITVFRDGEFIGSDVAENLNREKLIRMMVGREIKDVYPKVNVSPGKVMFEVQKISYKRKVRDVSFSIHAGEILGIAGLVGAGRSELVESIFGMRKRDFGKIFKNGKELQITHPSHAIRNKIALITEDRKMTGLNLRASVKDNITIAALKSKFSKGGLLQSREENQYVRKYVEKLRIKTPSGSTLVRNLSGGNQQKVVLSKWMVTEPEVIILDEPTRGIDVGAKRDIYILLGELAKEGKAILVISSEIPELMGICDRILVMAGGRITGEVERKDFSQELILSYAAHFEEAI